MHTISDAASFSELETRSSSQLQPSQRSYFHSGLVLSLLSLRPPRARNRTAWLPIGVSVPCQIVLIGLLHSAMKATCLKVDHFNKTSGAHFNHVPLEHLQKHHFFPQHSDMASVYHSQLHFPALLLLLIAVMAIIALWYTAKIIRSNFHISQIWSSP
jgi:hypothetical protein